MKCQVERSIIRDQRPRRQSELSEARRYRVQVAVACAVFVLAVGMLIYGTNKGLIFFDRPTHIRSSEPWKVGEFKVCSVTASLQEVFMVCDSSEGATASTREVRFWGKVALSSSTDPKMLLWKCVRNEDPSPALTCRKLLRIDGPASASSSGNRD
jgi:hypothetical protein